MPRLEVIRNHFIIQIAKCRSKSPQLSTNDFLSRHYLELKRLKKNLSAKIDLIKKISLNGLKIVNNHDKYFSKNWDKVMIIRWF
jgi:hypothetical protein